MTRPHLNVGAVVIGRNEGARLKRCLSALRPQVARVIYVDSGSTDGSREAAASLGAEVIALDLEQPFTAARARNAGLAQLRTGEVIPELVQVIDGDCELRDGWLDTALQFLAQTPKAAVVCGRRRERHPEASIYNRLIDLEWDTPIGQTRACGGDALMRLEALHSVGDFNPTLIAGEEPELCVRLRQAGWSIWRLDVEMTWHDAALTRFSQWWTRAKRAGHAYAEGAALHGAPPERHNVVQTRRALIWSAGTMVIILAGLFVSPLFYIALLAWPAQILRLALRSRDPAQAFFLSLGKLPEALGVLSYYRARLTGRKKKLIEYK
ncbi:GT2 family glycosyltransferase [Litoreibacter meonggei]|uniref:GT2 family glycosyltransferase n=1 Tax=Litoreibacter meonggei TaxID=1049199 RepID=A0A497VB82_9RHOB|nr:glycosyltransferase [Litoreibacter meonggei]RLJ36204.1 GT2 family glycosyltransferase [Litoreibacter meonggei]